MITMRLINLSIIVSFLFFTQIQTFGQGVFDRTKFKKTVRIGIYISPKVNLHTRIITDIAHYYEAEKVQFDKGFAIPIKDSAQYSLNNKKLSELLKIRRDSADAFDRIFTSAAGFISVSFNRSQSGNQPINYDDTLFTPLVKVENIANSKASNVIKRDTLDYFINIQNFNSIQKEAYYSIEFLVTIQPKDKTKKLISKLMTIPFINLQKKRDPFFYCQKPFECLLANTNYLFMLAISEKLYEDGYRKDDYASYKKEKALVK